MALRSLRGSKGVEVKRNKYATQGRCVIAALKRRPHTYMQMISIGVSASPWKRVMESLRIGESVVKETDKQGRTTWRVVAG